jgi:hypothetical protein
MNMLKTVKFLTMSNFFVVFGLLVAFSTGCEQRAFKNVDRDGVLHLLGCSSNSVVSFVTCKEGEQVTNVNVKCAMLNRLSEWFASHLEGWRSSYVTFAPHIFGVRSWF